MSNESHPPAPEVDVFDFAYQPPASETPTPPSIRQPVPENDRYAALDVLRGLALFGVLVVNIETCFRVSLAEYVIMPHNYAGLDHAAYLFITTVLQFKAFTLFSFSFGIGVAVQAERGGRRGLGYEIFFARRFLVLLGIGLVHIFLIWNGDILCLYAVCGLMLLPVLRLPVWVLVPAGVVAIVLNSVISFDRLLPTWDFYVTHAAQATETYANGSFAEIMLFRWHEVIAFDVPILVTVVPKTCGLMLLGIAAWRSGVLREPERFRWLLLICLILAGAVGAGAIALPRFAPEFAHLLPIWTEASHPLSYIPLAFAYAAAVFLCFGSRSVVFLARPLAAMGQMALSNYLTQSVVLGFIFYGYGLGYFGRLGPATTALIGLGLYAVQMVISPVWLNYFQFGPVEWLWRSLTYWRFQPIRRREAPV